jgi:hypothetical protein
LLVFGLLFAFGLCLGPINHPMHSGRQSAAMQTARAIDLALFAYANDNKGLYPDGTSSTEVFQKLMDGGYISDPAIFYVAMDGKAKATGDKNKLKPENVCWDVTGGVSQKDSGRVPVVFLTGFRVDYSPDGGIQPLKPFPPYEYFFKDSGVAVAFTDNSAAWLRPGSSGPNYSMEHVLPADFDAHGKTYRQLTPDGMLR